MGGGAVREFNTGFPTRPGTGTGNVQGGNRLAGLVPRPGTGEILLPMRGCRPSASRKVQRWMAHIAEAETSPGGDKASGSNYWTSDNPYNQAAAAAGD